MLGRVINYLWPSNAARVKQIADVSAPIRQLANELAGHGSYSRMMDYFHGVEAQPVTFSSQDPTQQLFDAIENNDFTAVKKMIEQGVPVDSVQLYGNWRPQSIMTPLIKAINSKQWDMARFLVDQGADVNFQSRNDVRETYYTSEHESPFMLLALYHWKNDEEARALFKYMTEKKGGDLSCVDSGNYLILHQAIKSGNKDLFDYCLKQGTPFDTVHNNLRQGHDAVYLAAMYNQVEMARILLQSWWLDADGRHAKWGYGTPLINAAGQATSRADMIQLLLHFGADINHHGVHGNTALHSAIEGGCLDNVRCLLEGGAALDAKNCQGKTPLDKLKAIEDSAKNYPDRQPGRPYPLQEIKRLLVDYQEKYNLKIDKTIEVPRPGC